MFKQSIQIATLAVAVLVSGCTGGSATVVAQSLKGSFQDLQGHWAESTVYAAVNKGYVDGYEDGTFRPNLPVTRAEFVKMVVSALGIDPVPVDPDKPWYAGYVNAAVNAGIHKWEDFTSGDWNTPLTREEMARLAVRAVGEDTDDPLKWMYLATSKGLIQGTDNTGKLDEKGTTTRAQAVTIIERILTIRSGGTIPADKRAVSRAEVLWHKTNVFTMLPHLFSKAPSGSEWNTNNLIFETPDGKYRAEVDALLVIDLEDPNDPFLKEIPDPALLKWRSYNGTMYPVKDYMNNYILYIKSHVDYNLDTDVYADDDSLPVSIDGFKENLEEEKKGILNRPTNIYLNKNGKHEPLPAFIIPKKVETLMIVSVGIYAPAYAPNPTYSRWILRGMPELSAK